MLFSKFCNRLRLLPRGAKSIFFVCCNLDIEEFNEKRGFRCLGLCDFSRITSASVLGLVAVWLGWFLPIPLIFDFHLASGASLRDSSYLRVEADSHWSINSSSRARFALLMVKMQALGSLWVALDGWQYHRSRLLKNETWMVSRERGALPPPT